MVESTPYRILSLVSFWVVAGVFAVLHEAAVLRFDVPLYGGPPTVVDLVGNIWDRGR
jgi:hypothetical protein